MTQSSFTSEQLQIALDAIVEHGSFAKASANTGIPVGRLTERHAEAIRLGMTPSVDVTEVINQLRVDNTPIKQSTGSADDCVRDLQRIFEAQGGRVSEGSYRSYGIYDDLTWKGHFSSFKHFMTQAGLRTPDIVSKADRRAAQLMEESFFEKENAFRQEIGAKYEKSFPTKGRISFLAMSDLHDQQCDPFFRRIAIDTAKRMQPSLIVLAGDIYDNYEFSSYPKDPAWCNVSACFKWVREFLRDLREACPDAQIDLLEGNHEHRLYRSLVEIPAIRELIGEVNGQTIPDLLRINEFEVNYIGKTSLALPPRDKYRRAATERSSKIYFDAFMADHYPSGAKQGYPGFNGHHHKHEVRALNNAHFGSYEWHQLGAGTAAKCNYGEGGKGWNTGFITGYVDLGYNRPRTQFTYWDFFDHAMINGVEYIRNDDEFVYVDAYNGTRR